MTLQKYYFVYFNYQLFYRIYLLFSEILNLFQIEKREEKTCMNYFIFIVLYSGTKILSAKTSRVVESLKNSVTTFLLRLCFFFLMLRYIIIVKKMKKILLKMYTHDVIECILNSKKNNDI